MKKLASLAAVAAMALSAAAPVAAAPAVDARAVSAVEGESELGGVGNWVWLIAALGAVVLAIEISGDSDTPVSP